MKVWSYLEVLTSTDLNSNMSELYDRIIPIGSILPFYDYNGALTFNTTIFAYCDGSTKVVGGVSRVLPDLSNRYLVGFGSEGLGDIASATWATPAVGNASHTINIAHHHTYYKSINHTHTYGGEVSSQNTGNSVSYAGLINSGTRYYHTHNYSGTTNNPNTGNATDVTSDDLSASQSIQPRSIRVRFIMRIA